MAAIRRAWPGVRRLLRRIGLTAAALIAASFWLLPVDVAAIFLAVLIAVPLAVFALSRCTMATNTTQTMMYY